jgi:tetratricopeptide (TPR) repeat protein
MSETAAPPSLTRFLFRARDSRGRTSFQEVCHSTAVGASEILAGRGFSSLELLEDGFERDLSATGCTRTLDATPAAMRVRLRERSLRRRSLFGSIEKHFWTLVLAALGANWLWRMLTGPEPFAPHKLPLYLGALVAGGFLGRIWLTQLLYHRLLIARAEYRWPAAAAIAKGLRNLRWLIGTLVPEFELLRVEAYALAYAGDLPGALEKVRPLENAPNFSKVLYLNLLGSVHGMAGDHASNIRYAKQAVAAAPGTADFRISLAVEIAVHGPDPEDAATILRQLSPAEIKPLARYHVAYAWGMIHLRRGALAEAENKLAEAIKEADARSGQPLIAGHLRVLRGWYCVVLKALGHEAEAEKAFARLQPHLVRRRESGILSGWERGLPLPIDR